MVAAGVGHTRQRRTEICRIKNESSADHGNDGLEQIDRVEPRAVQVTWASKQRFADDGNETAADPPTNEDGLGKRQHGANQDPTSAGPRWAQPRPRRRFQRRW